MEPIYIPGSPVGLQHILADWLKERALPASLDLNQEYVPGVDVWFIGGEHFTAEIESPYVIGWMPNFSLHAGDPEFFDKLEAIILNATGEKE